MEDIDLDNEFSTGDVMYLSDEETDDPFGTPVYEIEIIGQNADNRDIIQFNDFTTKEPLFVKTDKVEENNEMKTSALDYIAERMKKIEDEEVDEAGRQAGKGGHGGSG